MKVLLINGSPNKNGCTYTALHEVETTLNNNGIETELIYLVRQATRTGVHRLHELPINRTLFSQGYCTGHPDEVGRI